MMVLLFWLLVAHSLCDYPLQGEYLAAAKRRNSGHSTPWWIALTAHSLIHAGAVALITGSIALGLAEFVAHWCIDYSKCAHWFDGLNPGRFYQQRTLAQAEKRAFTIDQALHVGCKVAWVVFLYVTLSI